MGSFQPQLSLAYALDCSLPLNATMSWTHLKHLTFYTHGDGSLVHMYKKSPKNIYFAIHLLSLNRSAKL